MSDHNCTILDLPEIAIEKIFYFLSYDEIAKNRVVCKRFNDIGGKMLTRGFMQLEKRHATIHKRVKSMLPRRESERRAHPLSRHSDVLQAIETRISMLHMTYMKYIENKLICFIPGKVLDEMSSVLKLLQSDYNLPRTHQLLQELRDLSSMAMEHFDEQILPKVKEQMDRQQSYGMRQVVLKPPHLVFREQSVNNDLMKLKRQNKTYKRNITYLTDFTVKLSQKIRRQNFRLEAQSAKLKEQEKKIQEQHAKMHEQWNTLADMKKRMDEWEQKYTDLSNELVRVREDVVEKVHPTSVVPKFNLPTSLKFHKSNIKPRISHILPKTYGVALQLDAERKRRFNLLPDISDIPVKKHRNEEDKTNTDKNEKFDFSNNLSTQSNEMPPPTPPPLPTFNKELTSIIDTVNTSIESFKNSLSSLQNIQSRKRKSTEPINLK